jgi:hypothetical protein
MRQKFYLLLISCFLFCGFVKAQTTENWQPLTLNINGTNSFDGVEAQYALTSCNNNEFILLQITNHNSYTVKACWKNMVINTEDQKLPYNNTQDSVMIQPNSTVQGQCTGNTGKLVLKLTDFGILKEDFKAFFMNGFDFATIH